MLTEQLWNNSWKCGGRVIVVLSKPEQRCKRNNNSAGDDNAGDSGWKKTKLADTAGCQFALLTSVI